MYRKRWVNLIVGATLAFGAANANTGEALKVGYLPVTGHAKFCIAKEQGLFAQEGLDVELIEFINSADGLNAVVAGKLDIGAFGTTAPRAAGPYLQGHRSQDHRRHHG